MLFLAPPHALEVQQHHVLQSYGAHSVHLLLLMRVSWHVRFQTLLLRLHVHARSFVSALNWSIHLLPFEGTQGQHHLSTHEVMLRLRETTALQFAGLLVSVMNGLLSQ